MTAHDHHGKKMSKEEHDKADLFMSKEQLEKHQNKILVKSQVEDRPDPNFYNRIIVITTEGIQFLKNLPLKDQCKECNPSKFCPRGPIQDFVIKFLDLESIINIA